MASDEPTMRDFADHVIWGSAVRETHEFWGDPDTNGRHPRVDR